MEQEMGRGVLRRNYILYFTSRKPFRSLQENDSYTKVVYIGMTRPPLTLIKIFVSPPERNFWLKNRTLLSDRFE